MGILGEKYRWLVVVVLAVISVFVGMYNDYISILVGLLAFGYSIYSIPTNNELSKIRKVGKWVSTFIITSLLFSFTAKSVEVFLGLDKRPPTCNSIQVKQTLSEILNETDSNKYSIENTSIKEYNKEENIYYCTAQLKLDLTKNEAYINQNKVAQEALKNMVEKVGYKTVMYKVYSEDKKLFGVEIID